MEGQQSSSKHTPVPTNVVPSNSDSPRGFHPIRQKPSYWSRWTSNNLTSNNLISLESGAPRKILRPTRRFKKSILANKLTDLNIMKPKVSAFSKDDMYVDGPMSRNRAPPVRFGSFNQPVDETSAVDDLNREIQQLDLDDSKMNHWFHKYQEQGVPDGRSAPTADLFRPRTRLNDDLYKDLSNECSEASSPMEETDDDNSEEASANFPESTNQLEALDLCGPTTPKVMKFSEN